MRLIDKRVKEVKEKKVAKRLKERKRKGVKSLLIS